MGGAAGFWNFKWKRWSKLNTKKLLILFFSLGLCSVLVLTVMAVGLKESGVKPEEKAITASIELKGYMLPNGRVRNNILLSTTDKKIDIDEFRELEDQVKEAKLRTYTESIVWEATFTYKHEDGTEETYTYTKTDESKAVDEFLKKYYDDFDKDYNME